MEVVIRTDASLAIGSGHLMRCLTLAQELTRRGAGVSFVCREHRGNLNAFLAARGHSVLPLPPGDGRTWLGVTVEEDARQTAAALQGRTVDWLVVDHYALDRRWEEALRPQVGRIMAIDDLADRRHDCDLLLDQNLYHEPESRYRGLVPAGCRLLLGPRYALLRPEFLAARRTLRQRDGEVKRVLVFYGGVDAGNETGKAVASLAAIPVKTFAVDVVVGAANPRKEEIRQECARRGFRYHEQVDNIAELIAAADLALGAGGCSTWERCALGLPALVTTVAENQVQLALCAAEKGLIFYLGDAGEVSRDALGDAIRVLCSLPGTLRAASGNCLAAVDARGVLRVAAIMAPPTITIRPATEADREPVWRWRNDEETRRYIFDKSVIPWESHVAWFARTLDDPKRLLLIAEIAGAPVGVLRYDLTGEEALVSIYLVPGGQGQGIGTELLRAGSSWLKENHPGVKRVNAEILRENVASLSAFQQAGYREHHVTYQEVLQ